MPNDKQTPKELKVTDKRIFTADGQIREEFQHEARPAEEQAPKRTEQRQEKEADRAQPEQNQQAAGGDRRRSVADRATNPATPFTNFIEPLIAQAYMSLGMLRNPYQPQAKTDPAAARQMIDILTLLKEKTSGNLTADEDDFLDTHLGELKLAFVQRTKTI